MSPKHAYEEFDAYSRGIMTEEQKKLFEQSLSEDPAKRSAFDDYLSSNKLLDLMVFEDTRRRIEEAQSQMTGKPPAKVVKLTPRRRLAKVASVAALVVGSLGYSNVQYSDTALVRRGLEPAQSLIERTSARSSAEQAVANAADLFDAGQFQELLNTLSDVDASTLNPADADDIREMRGYAHLKLGQSTEAIDEFEELQNQLSNQSYRDVVAWELVLATLQSGDEALARQQLANILQEPDHDYFDEAQKLEKRLNRIWRKLVF